MHENIQTYQKIIKYTNGYNRSEIEENLISWKDRVMKVRSFPGATIEEMQDYTIPLLKNWPDNLILHVDANNTPGESARSALEKSFIETKMLDCRI